MSEHTNGNTNGRIDELKQGQLPEHHIHHAQGDIGGTYADQPEEGGPHPEAFRVGEIVKEQTIEEEEREFEINEREARLRKERISIPEKKKPILIIVMVRNLFISICMRTSIPQSYSQAVSLLCVVLFYDKLNDECRGFRLLESLLSVHLLRTLSVSRLSTQTTFIQKQT